MKKKYLDVASGIGIIAMAVALLYGSTTVKTLDVSRFGAGFFPAIVAGMLFVLGIVILVGGMRKAKGAGEKAADGEGKLRAWGVLATFGLMAAYATLMPIIGFIITTTVYLFVQMNILAAKKQKKQVLFGLVSVIASVSVYFTFVKVFQLMLPAGVLG